MAEQMVGCKSSACVNEKKREKIVGRTRCWENEGETGGKVATISSAEQELESYVGFYPHS